MIKKIRAIAGRLVQVCTWSHAQTITLKVRIGNASTGYAVVLTLKGARRLRDSLDKAIAYAEKETKQ